jgi:hypothetical protein
MDADAGAFGVPFGRGAGALRVHRLDQALEPAPACADAEEIVQPLTDYEAFLLQNVRTPARGRPSDLLRVFEADMDADAGAFGVPFGRGAGSLGYIGWMRLSNPPQLAPMPNRSSASIIA